MRSSAERPSLLLLLFLLAGEPSFGEAVLRGTVRTEGGAPVDGARVEVRRVSGGALQYETRSDGDGSFVLVGVVVPVELRVSHPAYAATTLTVSSDGELDLDVRLRARHHFGEDVVVWGRGSGDRFSPRSISSTAVLPDEESVPASSVVAAVAGVAGVAQNGQGGLLQVASVRGSAGPRVLSQVDGARITSERRAGVALSFLDPTLVGEIDVLRGPASTYYGSGALGGALIVMPRRFDLLATDLGYGSQGDERWLGVGGGGARWSLGIAHRRRGNGESAAGDRLHDGFVQTSATGEVDVGSDLRRIRLSALASLGEDIGKSNRDFPERTTTYPRERHLVLGASAESATWRARFFVHPQDLTTEVDDGASRDVVLDDSVDFGLLWERRAILGEGAEGRFGVDYFGRRNVDAVERKTRLDDGAVTELGSLRAGEEDEGAAVGVVSWRWRRARLEAGGRGTWTRQAAAAEESVAGSHLTGFFGAAVEVHRRLELIANVGRGFRVPTLSERFFVGTTGRGQVVGNPALDPESALDTELALRHVGERSFWRASLFRNRIAGLIERTEAGPRLYTFRNLGSGTRRGIEVSGLVGPYGPWSLSLTGHRIRGTDEDGRILADLPADRVRLEPRFSGARLTASAAVTWRRARSRVAASEVPLDGVVLVDASAGWRLAPNVTLFVVARNLSDQLYVATADEQAALSAGRSVGLRLSWQRR